METIEEVLRFNLLKLRGSRTQEEISAATGIPLRTYQHIEKGRIPKTRKYVAILARFYGVKQTELFLDPDLTSTPTPAGALEIIKNYIAENERRK